MLRRRPLPVRAIVMPRCVVKKMKRTAGAAAYGDGRTAATAFLAFGSSMEWHRPRRPPRNRRSAPRGRGRLPSFPSLSTRLTRVRRAIGLASNPGRPIYHPQAVCVLASAHPQTHPRQRVSTLAPLRAILGVLGSNSGMADMLPGSPFVNPGPSPDLAFRRLTCASRGASGGGEAGCGPGFRWRPGSRGPR